MRNIILFKVNKNLNFKNLIYKYKARLLFTISIIAFKKEYFFFANNIFKKLELIYLHIDSTNNLTSQEYFCWAVTSSQQAGGYEKACELYLKAYQFNNKIVFLLNYLNALDTIGKLYASQLINYYPTLQNIKLTTNQLSNSYLLYQKHKLHKQAKNFFDKINKSEIDSLQNTIIAFKSPEFLIGFNKKSTTNFQNMIEHLKLNKGNIAIVGNSSCEINKCKGDLIDKHSIVIRINNYNISETFAKDYGRKVNLWVRGGNKRLAEKSDADPEFILFALREIIYRKHNTQKLIEYHQQDVNATFIPVEIYNELIQILNSPPSSGMLIIYLVNKYIGGLSKDNLFGFNFIDHLDINKSSHYFEEHQTNLSHNWHGERSLFESIIFDKKFSN